MSFISPCISFRMPFELEPLPPACDAMEDKRRRLSKLISICGITDSGLSTLLQHLKGQEAPQASRSECNRAALIEYDAEVALQLQLPLATGGHFDWDICKPSALVQKCVAKSPALRRLFARSSSSPVSPWHIVLSHDEVTPGAVLRPHNKRKFVSFYMSFLQFGHAALRLEVCWFPLGIIRSSSILETVVGGISCALRMMLRAMFMQGEGNFSEGIILPLDDGPTYLFAKLQTHLGDEAALSRGLSCKGASGFRPCFRCSNVLKKESGILTPGGHLVEIDCVDKEKFVANTDEEAWRLYDTLVAAEGTISNANFEERQKAAGLTVVRNGVLSDQELRQHMKPISSHTYDWMHTWLSNGVCAIEVFNFLEACKANGFRDIYTRLGQYCKASWEFPWHHRHQGKAAHAIFCPSREAASKEHWRSSASELLSAYPLMRHFAERVVGVHFPALRHHVESFCCCFRVVDLLQDCKGGFSDTTVLHTAIREHLRKHASVYGIAQWKPKHHFTLHVPEQLERDGVLTDTFVVERSHLLPKIIANEIKNPTTFEKSSIARVLLHRMEELEAFDERSGVLGKDVVMCAELHAVLGGDHALLSPEARFNGVHIRRGDILIVDGYTLELAAVCKNDDVFYLLGCLLDPVRVLSPSSTLFRKQVGLNLLQWRSQRIRQSHAWARQANGEILTLQPALR